MQIPRLPTSRWFIYVSSGLLVFLCLAVLLAGLILFVQSSQMRIGQIAGSSMEPTLQGPRRRVNCDSCQTMNAFAVDAWNPSRPAICPCCGRSILVDGDPSIQLGESVKYMPTQWLKRTTRSRDSEPIRRGEIVVLERESGSLKEVKRVVGLPNEKVALRDGDLWVDDQRHQKTLREALSQSVLVAAWYPTRCQKTLHAFLDELKLPPSNELPINAHDSHAIVPAKDFGIALRCVRPITNAPWSFRLSDADRCYNIHVLTAGTWSVTCNESSLPKLAAGQGRGGESPYWMIVAMVDGRLLVGDESGACFGESIEMLSPQIDDQLTDLPPWSIAIDSPKRVAEMDLALVFRDLVYRGYGDIAEETIPAGPGYVVLGDNVSISNDSRGPAGNSIRWDATQIRGVVLPAPNALASLLRQSTSMKNCPCD